MIIIHAYVRFWHTFLMFYAFTFGYLDKGQVHQSVKYFL